MGWVDSAHQRASLGKTGGLHWNLNFGSIFELWQWGLLPTRTSGNFRCRAAALLLPVTRQRKSVQADLAGRGAGGEAVEVFVMVEIDVGPLAIKAGLPFDLT
jgi:hypothetical protein